MSVYVCVHVCVGVLMYLCMSAKGQSQKMPTSLFETGLTGALRLTD